jgi:Plavaka transposase
MRTRSCPDCDKIVKSLSGLTRHQPKCPVRTGKEARVVWDNPQADQDQHSKAQHHLHEQAFDKSKGYTGGPGHNGENGDSIDPAGPVLFGHNVQGRLSTMASIRTETYEEVTGIKAGEPLPRPRYRYPDYETKIDDRKSDHAAYSPFQSSTDFALAQWFLSAGCTKRDIDRFFGDERLAPIQKLLSFTSHDELMTRIHNIPYGIKDDAWTVRDIEVGQDTLGSPPNRYQIRYRNVVKAVEFLIGHRPFAPHLVYAPVRLFSGTGNDNRIYNEMHTAEWWWRTQSKVPEGATVVPILLATDKTMLTQHHGDESAWPIYLTIGNLDRATRRKQTVPGSVLLGFLPVTSEAADDSKARVYHMAMEAILERK